jgi:hypothetical protein
MPNLLVNGASGIAVGMTTNVPPHNLGEVCDALAFMIDHYDKIDDITVEELMQFIKGPDFPTGGIVSYGEEKASSSKPPMRPVAGAWSCGARAHIEEAMLAVTATDHRHRAALPGQQGGADRAHRRAGARPAAWKGSPTCATSRTATACASSSS